MTNTLKQIDVNDLDEIIQDLKGLEHLLLHMESSEYFKHTEEDSLAFRAIRNSIEHTNEKIVNIIRE